MLLSEIFNAQHIKLDLESKTKEEAFEELIEAIIAQHPELNRHELLEAITTREEQMNTAVGPGVAMPHGYCHTLNGVVGVIGISRAGIEYDTDERDAVHCIFMVLMGYDCREKHLPFLSRLVSLLNSEVLLEMQAAKNIQDVHHILCQFEKTDLRGLI